MKITIETNGSIIRCDSEAEAVKLLNKLSAQDVEEQIIRERRKRFNEKLQKKVSQYCRNDSAREYRLAQACRDIIKVRLEPNAVNLKNTAYTLAEDELEVSFKVLDELLPDLNICKEK